MRLWWLALIAFLTTAQLASRTASAVEPSGTLVLYNLASPEGAQIANYYQSVHPGVQLLGITGIGTSEYITADEYLAPLTGLRSQVLSALTPDIDLIVTTKGMPLRVHVTQAQPTPQEYPNILQWRPYSSLESELAAIDTISTWQMMGDQSWPWSGHFTRNPYYKSNSSFDHDLYGTRLTARLDGYTVSDVTDAIDRAQNVFIGPTNNPNGPYHFLVDNDPSRPYDYTMDKLVNEVLVPNGMPLTYDDTGAFVGATPGPLIGYASHGIHQASTALLVAQEGIGYIDYITDTLGQTLADGAVFTSIESYNAYSFDVGGYGGTQGQVAQWLAAGGTAGVGNVEEPTASWVTLTNEDVLFRGLLDGKTFGEAAWAATFQVSFVNTFVGDPLMTWRTLIHGDINRDGYVDIGDLVVMSNYWGQSVSPGGYSWTIGDVNSDGLVNIADLVILSNHWGESSPWANGGANLAGYNATELGVAMQLYTVGVPEPSSIVLFALGMAGLLAYRPWSRVRFGRRRTS